MNKQGTTIIERIKSLLTNNGITTIHTIRDLIEDEMNLFLTESISEILFKGFYTFNSKVDSFTLTMTIYLDDSYPVESENISIDTKIKIKSIVVVVS